MMTRLPSLRHPFLRALLVLAVVAADQASKAWAMRELAPYGSVRVLPFLRLTYVENTGAAWSILKGGNALLIAVSLGLLAGLLVLRRRWPQDNHWAHYGALLVAGGALGNLYDRLTLGCVVDFLELPYWPVFNVADSCICVGAACLAWGLRDKTGKCGCS